MTRIGHCVCAGLLLGLIGCNDEPSEDKEKPAANEAQPAVKAQPARKTAASTCPQVYTQLPVGTPDLTRKVFACVERNAHLYAKGPDSPEQLSRAVMAKCKDTIAQYVDQEAKKAGVKPPYKEAFESWAAHTLPVIAEARARRCYAI